MLQKDAEIPTLPHQWHLVSHNDNNFIYLFSEFDFERKNRRTQYFHNIK